MRLLDLFCGAGGAAMGYHQAGFTEIVGVDIEDQPNYPFEFIQGDVFEVMGGFLSANKLGEFDLIHASPPCQAYSTAQRLWGNVHPDLIRVVYTVLHASDRPWVIENVPGAPLQYPFELCGAMFGLGTYRHRLFDESGFRVQVPNHPAHSTPTTKMGRPPKRGEMMHVVGNFSGVQRAREAMGIHWMTRDELKEAIPPAYTKFIGEQFIAQAVAA